MMPSGLSIAEVSACIEARRKAVRFPNPIERVYQAETRSYRAKALRSGVLPAILIYNVFLPADIFLLPRTIWVSIWLHVAVTLWIVVAGRILRAEPPWQVRESIAVSIPSLMIAQILTVYALNNGEGSAEHYQYLVLAILIYMNVNVRPAFGFALVASLALGLVYSATLIVCGGSTPTLVVGLGFMAAVIHLTLVANWRMERDARYAFLHRLLDRLRREEAEAEANRDALTGLGNRRLLEQAASGLWQEGRHTAMPAAVILLDVDHFKAFNDRYGHPSGDFCLKRIAEVMRSTLSGADEVAARFGGEEFLLLLPRANLPQATRIAERVRRAVEQLAIPHEASGKGFVTVSLGVMAGPVSRHSLGELIEGADMALYAAKRAGRNQVWPPFVAQEGGGVTSLEAVRRQGKQAG
jgi:diguanylate cyclase (GGDEF)-like protein